jgi:hypothetical protein
MPCGDRVETGDRHLQAKKGLGLPEVRRVEEGSAERLQRDCGPMYTLVSDFQPLHTAALDEGD